MKKIISIGFIAAVCIFGYNSDVFSDESKDIAVVRGCKAVLLENGETAYIGTGCHAPVRN
jgi:hypothetical protein